MLKLQESVVPVSLFCKRRWRTVGLIYNTESLLLLNFLLVTERLERVLFNWGLKGGKLLLRDIMKPKQMGGIRQKKVTGVKGELQCLLCVNHRGAEQKLLLFLFLLPPFLIYKEKKGNV